MSREAYKTQIDITCSKEMQKYGLARQGRSIIVNSHFFWVINCSSKAKTTLGSYFH